MACFAPTAPAHILRELDLHGALGEYHLLLAHDVTKKGPDEIYRRLFGLRPFHGVVIMDNSVIELGNAVDLGMVKAAVETTSANVVVLPDVLMDGRSTYNRISQCLAEWESAFHDKALMAIPQGATWSEWLCCAQRLAELPRIKWWGVPKNVNEKLGISRRTAVEVLNMLSPGKIIHLMGFSDDLTDDMLSAIHHPNVKGIDSAVPLRLPNQGGRPFTLGMTAIPKRGDWWDTATWDPKMLDNVSLVRRWLHSNTLLTDAESFPNGIIFSRSFSGCATGGRCG